MKRAIALLVLPLQLTGIGVSGVDARLEASGRDGGHVESERQSACRPHHDPALCPLCRILAEPNGEASVRHGAALEAPAEVPAPVCRTVALPIRLPAADAAPRAPPASRL